jgi:hypothetical protein
MKLMAGQGMGISKSYKKTRIKTQATHRVVDHATLNYLDRFYRKTDATFASPPHFN